MSLRPYIPVDVENLPERFEFDFGNKTYILRFFFNSVGEFFSLDIFDINMTPIVLGEKIVINKPLWQGVNNTDLPFETIIPMDESGKETEITIDNFGKTVFLYLDIISPDLSNKETGGVVNAE